MTRSTDPEDRLDSWKGIAAYLNRGVRTVRRWEREEGLPVHRHVHRVLGSVYAYKSELEAWLQTASGRDSGSVVPAHASHGDEATSIAVLPFTNLSADPENDYFAAGLSDEVRADLSKLHAIRVISRTSSIALKRSLKDLKAMARQAGVRHILEGSVRRSGDTLRVTAQLVDAAADRNVWADSFDGAAAEVFAIEDRLARTIVDALELRLTAEEDRRLAERPIADVHAYECYLRSRHEALRWRRDAIDYAIQLLRNGLTIVGANATLYAALGVAYLQYREAGLEVSERPLEEAEACARHVFALAPESASGLHLRGWIHYSRARIQDAVRDLNAALAIERHNADTLLLLTNCYLISGQIPAARALIARLLAVDPLTPVSRCMPAFADVMEGKIEAAIGPYRQMFDMDPGNPMARLFYVWALVLNGRVEAVAEVLKTFPSETRDTLPARVAFFLAGAAAGKGEEAQAALGEGIEPGAAASDVFARFLAQGYALAGMAGPALRWLGIAVERGFINHAYVSEHDPCFSGLRGDPRFQDLVTIMKRRADAFEP